MWPRDVGNFGIDVGGGDRKIIAFGLQITDVGQERFERRDAGPLTRSGEIPLVDLRLQVVALLQQLAVARSEVADHLTQLAPEVVRVHASAGRNLIADQVIEFFGNIEAANLNGVHHFFLLRQILKREIHASLPEACCIAKP